MAEPPPTSIPFHLMPLAAICGTYTLISSIIALNTLYRNLTYKTSSLKPPPTPLKSRSYLFLILSIILSLLGYAHINARVSNILHLMSPFSPYEILSLPDGTSDMSLIKQTYRSLSKIHHPDKGGDEAKFHEINLAYQTLTDETSRENWILHGHPDGPQTTTLEFALPEWLLHPQGAVAVVLVVTYLGLFVGIIRYVVRYVTTTANNGASRTAVPNSVAKDDIGYLVEKLSSTATPLDVLLLLATTPENVQQSAHMLDKIGKLKKKKLELMETDKKSHLMDLSGDWGDDDDDDDANERDEATKAQIAAAKTEEWEKERHKAALAAATGNIDARAIKMEGIDDGVLGQGWVEATLRKKGAWPPKSALLERMRGWEWVVGGGTVVTGVDLLDIEPIRRNLVMTMGRLNAQILNAHPELTAAAQAQQIDSTYFRSTVEYRQRTGLLLEAALRIATTTQCYPLAKTLVETVTLFKIGCTDPTNSTWFLENIKKQYGVAPQLVIEDKLIECEGEDEIATGDSCFLKIGMNRTHAEGFTRAKIELAKKQGIHPQTVLRTYQEGWWVLLRAVRVKLLDGTPVRDEFRLPSVTLPPGVTPLSPDQLKTRYHADEQQKDVMLSCWPSIVTSISQAKGKVKIPFTAPDLPGIYKVYVDVKSQEFLGCDQGFEMEMTVLDVEEVKRKQKEEEEEEEEDGKEEDGEDEEGEEDKKDK